MAQSSGRPEIGISSSPVAGISSTDRVGIALEPWGVTGRPRPSGYADLRVSPSSGNFVEVGVDLGFGPTAVDLQVRRSYGSLDNAEGPFGPGWSSWASCRLAVDGTGEWADWRGPDGQVARIPLPEGTCPGFEGRVSVTGSDLVASFPRAATTWRFDATGRLEETSRGPGTAVRFDWEGSRLVSMSHGRGPLVELGWEGERIVLARADDGRQVTYGYDAKGHLVSVDGPMGARRYEVDAAGLILSVTDADDLVAVVNTYDDRRRVVAQRTAFGRSVRFHYGDDLVTTVDDDDGGPVNRYEHDRYGRLLRAVDGHGKAVTCQYDGPGRVVAVTDRNGAVTRYEWDEHDRETATIDPNGVRTETAYDDLHRPVSVIRGQAVTRFTYVGDERTPYEIIDPTGAVTRFDVADGSVRRVTDPDGVAVTFDYDGRGRVVAATDAVGGVRRYEWDLAGQLAAVMSPGGRRTTFGHDPAGRLVEQVTPSGAVWRHERSAAGRITATVDPLGNRRTFERGGHGHVTAEIDPLGTTTRTSYDAFGNVTGRSLPGGGSWTFAYDALMRLVSTTDPSGASWLREYDAEGNLTASITPEGVGRSSLVDRTGRTIELHDGITSARFDHDDLGRPVAQTRPDGTTAAATYDLAGRLVSVTEPTGGTTRFRYSPAGRLIGVTGPEGGTARYAYDEAGRLFAATDALGGVRRFRYDRDGRIIRLTRPSGETVRYRYDADGRVAAVTAPDGGVRRFTHDLAGRLLTETDPTGATVTFRYNPAGRLISVTDPGGGTTHLERDLLGRVIAATDPLGAVTRVRRDEMGRVTERTDPLGRRTEMAYDRSGRLVGRVDPDGRRWHWAYDASDRIRTWGVDGDPDVTVERDLLGRVIRLDDGHGSTVERAWNRDGKLLAESTTTPHGTVTMTWRYDQAGRRIAWTTDGRETLATLDAAGRIRELLDPDTGPITISRDLDGRTTRLAAAGRVEARQWRNGHLTGRTVRSAFGTTITTFMRDLAGRVIDTTTTAPSGATTTQQAAYDAAGQLIHVADPGGERAFDYDTNGRLTTETGPEGRTTHRYDQAGQRTHTASPTGDVGYTWDPAGRRLTEAGQLRTRRYRYDHLGRISAIATTTVDGAHTDRRFGYDPLNRLAAVDGTVLGWDPVDPCDALRRVGNDRLIGVDIPIATVAPTHQISWLDTDRRGSAGSTDPWGAATTGPDRWPSPSGGLGLGFGGRFAIDDQLWMRARLYDPASRSFTTPDPRSGFLGHPCAANRYHVATNDPLNQLDPSGLRPTSGAELDRMRIDRARDIWDRHGGDVVGLMIAVGAWASSPVRVLNAFSRLGPLGQSVVLDNTERVAGDLASRTVAGDNPFDPRSRGADLFIGGVTSGAGNRLGTRNEDLEAVDLAVDPPRITFP